MNKTDKILKAAKVFEALAHCENKQAMIEVIKTARTYSSESGIGETYTSPTASGYSERTPNSSVTKSTPQFHAPELLRNKNDILKFQQNLTTYVKADPSFNEQLTQALSGIPWGQGGKSKDIDGIAGPRTIKAWNLYKQYASTLTPELGKRRIDHAVEMKTQTEKATNMGIQLAAKFRDKLRVMRQRIAKETNNFNTHNPKIGSDKILQAWMPYLNEEYSQLTAGYNQFTPELQSAISSLVQYMKQLAGGYMKAPPAEPKIVLNIEDAEYIPTEI